MTPLAAWYLRAEKKGPYYLYAQEPFINYRRVAGWNRYFLIWRETKKGVVKTKFASAEDGLSARYGFDTLGVLSGTSVTGLWQASANSIDEAQLQAMLEVAKETTTLLQFNIRLLKDVDW